MSEGPIKRARAAWRPPQPVERGVAVCLALPSKTRGYCGLTKPKERLTPDPNKVTCPECQAAIRADEATKENR